MRDQIQKFAFEAVGLGNFIKTRNKKVTYNKNKHRNADNNKRGDLRLLHHFRGKSINCYNRDYVHDAPDYETKRRALPKPKTRFPTFGKKVKFCRHECFIRRTFSTFSNPSDGVKFAFMT